MALMKGFCHNPTCSCIGCKHWHTCLKLIFCVTFVPHFSQLAAMGCELIWAVCSHQWQLFSQAEQLQSIHKIYINERRLQREVCTYQTPSLVFLHNLLQHSALSDTCISAVTALLALHVWLFLGMVLPHSFSHKSILSIHKNIYFSASSTTLYVWNKGWKGKIWGSTSKSIFLTKVFICCPL